METVLFVPEESPSLVSASSRSSARSSNTDFRSDGQDRIFLKVKNRFFQEAEIRYPYTRWEFTRVQEEKVKNNYFVALSSI